MEHIWKRVVHLQSHRCASGAKIGLSLKMALQAVGRPELPRGQLPQLGLRGGSCQGAVAGRGQAAGGQNDFHGRQCCQVGPQARSQVSILPVNRSQS